MTIIMVAHRLSTVTHADNIFVIENRTVCEGGTYEGLIKREITLSGFSARGYKFNLCTAKMRIKLQ